MRMEAAGSFETIYLFTRILGVTCDNTAILTHVSLHILFFSYILYILWMFLTKYNSGDEINKNVMGGAYNSIEKNTDILGFGGKI